MPPLLPEGSRLRARYRIAGVIDSSRLRNIYLAEDLHLKGNTWVVKQMQPVGVDGSAGRLTAEFEAQARLISSLEHANIPKLLDFFVQDSYLYIVREWVPGRDLFTILAERGGVLSEKEAIKTGIQLAGLMNYLFKKKLSPIVFRELSLHNLILSPEGKLKLVDFGFGRLFQRESRLGPPDYSAPEQFTEEEEVDARSLVYNVGALVYHILTGYNPGSSPFNLDPVEDLNPEVSAPTCRVVKKATENDKKRRFANLADLQKALQQALEARAAPPARKKKKAPKRPPPPPGGTVKVSGDPYATLAVTNRERDASAGGVAWLVGIILTLIMGGSLVAIYQFFLRPSGGP